MEHPNVELKELKQDSIGTISTENYLKTDLGMLPEDWELTSLNDNGIFSFINGLWKGKKEPFVKINVLRNTNFENDGKISYKDVAELDVQKNQYKTRKLEKGDIILERSGGSPKQPVGRVVYFELNSGSYSFSNFTTRIRVLDKNRCLSKYLHYFLLHFYNKGYTECLQERTTGIRNLNFNKYKEMLIPLPSINEQNKIVKVLSLVQENIEKIDAVIESSKSLKNSMMKYLFTYGPVMVNGAANVPQKETVMGWINEDWKILTLKEIADIKSGGTPSRKKPEYWNGEIPWVKTGEIKYNRIKETEEKISLEGLDNSSAKIIPKGTILMAMYGQGITRGRVAILGIDASINQACAAIIPSNVIRTDFLFYFLSFNYEKIRNMGHGSNQKNLSATLIKTIPIAIPKSKDQEIIARILEMVDEKIHSEVKNRNILHELFKTLLNDLMTAKIRAKDLEI